MEECAKCADMAKAVSEIEKKYTKVQDGSKEPNDGNHGMADNGVEDYSKMSNPLNDKKSMMIKALSKG